MDYSIKRSFGPLPSANLFQILYLVLSFITRVPSKLAQKMQHRRTMYTDDTSITIAGASSYEIDSKMNADLGNIYEWLRANRLTLNTTKMEFLLVGSRQRSSKVTFPALLIGGEKNPKIPAAKSLGVYIDETLT